MARNSKALAAALLLALPLMLAGETYSVRRAAAGGGTFIDENFSALTNWTQDIVHHTPGNERSDFTVASGVLSCVTGDYCQMYHQTDLGCSDMWACMQEATSPADGPGACGPVVRYDETAHSFVGLRWAGDGSTATGRDCTDEDTCTSRGTTSWTYSRGDWSCIVISGTTTSVTTNYYDCTERDDPELSPADDVGTGCTLDSNGPYTFDAAAPDTATKVGVACGMSGSAGTYDLDADNFDAGCTP